MQNMIHKRMIESFWVFGLGVGLTAAVMTAAIFTAWNWVENPSGIFHDSSGTNWGFVYDTAISWFLPTFLYTTVAASIMHMVVSKILAIFRKKHSLEGEGGDT